MEEEREAIILKLTKIAERDDAIFPNNIEVGHVRMETMLRDQFKEPVLNERFWIGTFSTSEVQGILIDNVILTHNSVYQWELISDVNLKGSGA